jgi:hypothetical protein
MTQASWQAWQPVHLFWSKTKLGRMQLSRLVPQLIKRPLNLIAERRAGNAGAQPALALHGSNWPELWRRVSSFHRWCYIAAMKSRTHICWSVEYQLGDSEIRIERSSSRRVVAG